MTCQEYLADYLFTGLYLLIVSELVTTETELRTIAVPAIIGLKYPSAASGIAITL